MSGTPLGQGYSQYQYQLPRSQGGQYQAPAQQQQQPPQPPAAPPYPIFPWPSGFGEGPFASPLGSEEILEVPEFDPTITARDLYTIPTEPDKEYVIDRAMEHYEMWGKGGKSPSFPYGIGPGYDFEPLMPVIERGREAYAQYQKGKMKFAKAAKRMYKANQAIDKINAMYKPSVYWAESYAELNPDWLPEKQSRLPDIYNFGVFAKDDDYEGPYR